MSTTVELHRKDAELQAVRAELVALRAGVAGLADEIVRTANECERLSHVRAGLNDERDLSTAALVNRKRADNIRDLLTDAES